MGSRYRWPILGRALNAHAVSKCPVYMCRCEYVVLNPIHFSNINRILLLFPYIRYHPMLFVSFKRGNEVKIDNFTDILYIGRWHLYSPSCCIVLEVYYTGGRKTISLILEVNKREISYELFKIRFLFHRINVYDIIV